MARLTTGRDKVLSTYRSYHGNTGAAVVATGDWRRVPNEYARGHVHFFGPFLYRSEFWSTSPEQETERALHHLERIIQAEGAVVDRRDPARERPGHRGRARAAARLPRGRARALRQATASCSSSTRSCAGFGRTGDWFAWQNESSIPTGVVPDLITFAKGVNSGYVPAGGVIISESIAHAFDDAGVPGRPDLLGAPARDGVDRGVHRRHGRRGHSSRTRRAIGRGHLGPRPRRPGRRASAHRRGARARRVLGARPRQRPARRGNPSRAPPSGRSRRSSCRAGCCRSSSTTASTSCRRALSPPDEVLRGLAIYDEAFTAVEAHALGSARADDAIRRRAPKATRSSAGVLTQRARA